jgi:RES domain
VDARAAAGSHADRGGAQVAGAAGPLSGLREPADLTGFPGLTMSASQALARIHRQGHSPWWFSSDGSGRFDLDPERGTCYLAEEPLGAFVEAFRDPRIVSGTALTSRALATLRVPTDITVADCTVERARAFGITLEHAAGSDYELCRRWAEALAAAGFQGVRYRLRHDPSGSLIGIAVFGHAGEEDWPVERTERIPDALIREAEERFGVIVVPGVLR